MNLIAPDKAAKMAAIQNNLSLALVLLLVLVLADAYAQIISEWKQGKARFKPFPSRYPVKGIRIH
jgi:hypothetical protein